MSENIFGSGCMPLGTVGIFDCGGLSQESATNNRNTNCGNRMAEGIKELSEALSNLGCTPVYPLPNYGKLSKLLNWFKVVQNQFRKDTTPESMVHELVFDSQCTRKEGRILLEFFQDKKVESFWNESTKKRAEYIELHIQLNALEKTKKAIYEILQLVKSLEESKSIKNAYDIRIKYFSLGRDKVFSFDGLCAALDVFVSEKMVSENKANFLRAEISKALKNKNVKEQYLFKLYDIEARIKWMEDLCPYYENEIRKIQVELYKFESNGSDEKEKSAFRNNH